MPSRIPNASPFAAVAAALSRPAPRSPFAAAASALADVRRDREGASRGPLPRPKSVTSVEPEERIEIVRFLRDLATQQAPNVTGTKSAAILRACARTIERQTNAAVRGAAVTHLSDVARWTSGKPGEALYKAAKAVEQGRHLQQAVSEPLATSSDTTPLRDTLRRILVEEPIGSATWRTKDRLLAILDKLRALGFVQDPEAAISLFIGDREWTFEDDIRHDADGSFARRWGLARVPAVTGERTRPERERRFHEQFSTLFPDAPRVLRRLMEDIAPKVAADQSYQNAQKNTPQTARIEHDRALGQVMLGLLKDDLEVYKAWADNPPFKRFASDLVFELTSARPPVAVGGAVAPTSARHGAADTRPPDEVLGLADDVARRRGHLAAHLAGAEGRRTPGVALPSERGPGLSRREMLQARELAEMEQLLAAAGYDPVHAKRLSAEGMGPFELEDRLKLSPGAIGSLPYTHGIERRTKPSSTRLGGEERRDPATPRAEIAPEDAAADTAAPLRASRELGLANSPAERVVRHAAAADTHRAAAREATDEAREAHEAAAHAHEAAAAAEAAAEKAPGARNLETSKVGRERTARLLSVRVAQTTQALADANARLDLAMQRVERPGERALVIKSKLAAITPGTTVRIEGYTVRRVEGDLWLWNILDSAEHAADEALSLDVTADALAVPKEVLAAADHVRAQSAVEPSTLAPPLTNATLPGASTLYYQGDHGMAYRKVEVRDVELFVRPYAQYSAAVRVRFTPKGSRTQREMWLTYKPTLVILAGHGHPAPAGMWTDPKSAAGDATTQMSRHLAFSDAWTNEARTMIADYAARTGVRVLADFHGYDVHRRLTEAERATWDAVRGDERREAY